MRLIADLPKMTIRQITHEIEVAKDFIIAAGNELENRYNRKRENGE